MPFHIKKNVIPYYKIIGKQKSVFASPSCLAKFCQCENVCNVRGDCQPILWHSLKHPAYGTTFTYSTNKGGNSGVTL